MAYERRPSFAETSFAQSDCASELGRPDSNSVTEVRIELEVVDGRTRMTLTHVGIPADSPGATGWNMALDKLATYVEENSGR